MVKTLDDLLDDVFVLPPGAWQNQCSVVLSDWWAVAAGDAGIVAYFRAEVDAFRFRLDYVNRILNP